MSWWSTLSTTMDEVSIGDCGTVPFELATVNAAIAGPLERVVDGTTTWAVWAEGTSYKGPGTIYTATF